MATKTGASGVVKIAASGGSVAVVGEVRSFTFDGSADTIEDSVMGDTARSYKEGLKTNTVTIECYWDEADAQQLILDERAAVDFEIYPTGTGTGEILLLWWRHCDFSLYYWFFRWYGRSQLLHPVQRSSN